MNEPQMFTTIVCLALLFWVLVGLILSQSLGCWGWLAVPAGLWWIWKWGDD